MRPDIVIQKGEETYIIDTKWKRPKNNQPSLEDLQMYTYSRLWDTEKVMLLYPRDPVEAEFIPYHNPDRDRRNHRCKVGFVSVLTEDQRLNRNIGSTVLAHLSLSSLESSYTP